MVRGSSARDRHAAATNARADELLAEGRRRERNATLRLQERRERGSDRAPVQRADGSERTPRQVAGSVADVARMGSNTKASSLILGFFAWVWLVLPFIHGGPAEVGAVLRAKFLNQTSGGKR